MRTRPAILTLTPITLATWPSCGDPNSLSRTPGSAAPPAGRTPRSAASLRGTTSPFTRKRLTLVATSTRKRATCALSLRSAAGAATAHCGARGRWVFCEGGGPETDNRCFSFDIHNHTRGECWLKRQADPSRPTVGDEGAYPPKMRSSARAIWPWAVDEKLWPWEMPDKAAARRTHMGSPRNPGSEPACPLGPCVSVSPRLDFSIRFIGPRVCWCRRGRPWCQASPSTLSAGASSMGRASRCTSRALLHLPESVCSMSAGDRRQCVSGPRRRCMLLLARDDRRHRCRGGTCDDDEVIVVLLRRRSRVRGCWGAADMHNNRADRGTRTTHEKHAHTTTTTAALRAPPPKLTRTTNPYAYTITPRRGKKPNGDPNYY